MSSRNEAAAVHPGGDLQDDSGVLILDGGDDRGAGGDGADGRAGGDRHLVAHFDGRGVIVEHHQLGCREHGHVGDRGQRVQSRLGSCALEEEGQAGKVLDRAGVGRGGDPGRRVVVVVGEPWLRAPLNWPDRNAPLQAILQGVVQGDLADRGVDHHLQGQDIELAKGVLDQGVVAGRGEDGRWRLLVSSAVMVVAPPLVWTPAAPLSGA